MFKSESMYITPQLLKVEVEVPPPQSQKSNHLNLKKSNFDNVNIIVVQLIFMNINLKVKRIDQRTQLLVMADGINNAVEIVVANVTRVQVNIKDDFTRVTLFLNKKLKAFAEDKETHIFNEIETNMVTFSAGEIVRLAETNEIAAFFISISENVYTSAVMGKLLFGAKVTIENVFHAKGEVIEGKDEPLARDQWFKSITRYEPGEMALKLMNKELGL